MDRLVGSPTINPRLDLEPVLAAVASVGFKHFEAMTSWASSSFDLHRDPQVYRDLLMQHGLDLTSLHLPAVSADADEALDEAVKGAQFANALGAEVVIFKADSRDTYVRTASRFLDAIEPLGLTTVITNHANSPIATLDDYRAVLDGVDDPRLKGLLEVGHFHAVGVSWREGYDLLAGRVGLVHIKDMRGSQPVPYGEGEVNFAGLFAHLAREGYRGRFVVELEKVAPEQAVPLLRDAVAHIQQIQSRLGESQAHE